MKHLFTLLLISILGFANAQTPKANYTFDGNANDISGNSYDGTVNGASLTTDRFGVANSAYSFDGVDDYIDLPDGIRFESMNSASVSFWMKTTQTTRYDLLTQRSGVNDADLSNFNITFNHTGGFDIHYSFPEYATSNAARLRVTDIGNFDNDEWHHFLFIKDTIVDSMFIYMDCNKVGATGIINYPFVQNGTLTIGRHYSPTFSYFFNGSFDDLQIFDAVVNPNTIITLCSDTLRGEVAAIKQQEFNAFELYPNPTTGRLILKNFTGENASINIISANGQVINTEVIRSRNHVIDFNTFGINEGLYLIQIRNKDNELLKSERIVYHR